MRTIPMFVALALCLTALPLAAADHGLPHEGDCRGGSGAWFSGASADGNALQLNGQSFALPRGLLHATVSGDGYVSVDITFRCIEAYHFVAIKTSQITGTTIEVDTVQAKACGSGVDTWQLPVGLDFAHYDLVLEWWGCDGASGKDHRSIDVCDPPLPWTVLAKDE